MATLTDSVYAWFDAYVENRLFRAAGGNRLVRGDDGDWEVGTDAGRVCVRLRRDPYWSVEVFAIAATGVRALAGVLRELNDLNARLASATVVLAAHARTEVAEFAGFRVVSPPLHH